MSNSKHISFNFITSLRHLLVSSSTQRLWDDEFPMSGWDQPAVSHGIHYSKLKKSGAQYGVIILTLIGPPLSEFQSKNKSKIMRLSRVLLAWWLNWWRRHSAKNILPPGNYTLPRVQISSLYLDNQDLLRLANFCQTSKQNSRLRLTNNDLVSFLMYNESELELLLSDEWLTFF